MGGTLAYASVPQEGRYGTDRLYVLNMLFRNRFKCEGFGYVQTKNITYNPAGGDPPKRPGALGALTWPEFSD